MRFRALPAVNEKNRGNSLDFIDRARRIPGDERDYAYAA